jgi:hypothetical protein
MLRSIVSNFFRFNLATLITARGRLLLSETKFLGARRHDFSRKMDLSLPGKFAFSMMLAT